MRRYRIRIIALSAAAVVMISACSLLPGNSSGKGDLEIEETTMLTIENETEQESTGAVKETETAAGEETESGDTETPAETEGQSVSVSTPQTTEGVVYAVADVKKTMYVTSAVNVRTGYSTQSSVITSLPAGQKVEVTGESANGWMRVLYNGREAYIAKSYLSDKATAGGSQGKTETKPQPTNPQPTNSQPTNPSAVTPTPETGGNVGNQPHPTNPSGEGTVTGPSVAPITDNNDSGALAPGGTSGPGGSDGSGGSGNQGGNGSPGGTGNPGGSGSPGGTGNPGGTGGPGSGSNQSDGVILGVGPGM